MELTAGSRVGPYEILGPIGAGGMSEVYRARDVRLDRDVALKVLQRQLAARAPAVARFEKEAKAVAALSHPNIVAIYDFGVENGLSYIVMELLEGETLRRSMDGPMPWRRAAKFAATIADALRAAHARGIVHRDLKPENIVVAREGALKVLDFGLASVAQSPEADTQTMTASGTVMGTPGYMAPEQVRGEPLGPTADLFALGCIFYEMLSGRRAFGRSSSAETMAAILRDDIDDLRAIAPDVPESVVRVVEHCLEKEATNRFQTAADFAFALSTAVDGSEGSARAPRSSMRPAVPSSPAVALRERRVPLVMLTLLFIAIVAAIIATRRGAPAAPPRTPARSLAVLPFANSNGDPALAWVTDGLTEGVINNLSPVSGFKVLSRDSVFSYRKSSNDPREIGRDLGVDALVSGRVMQRGQSLVVSVELIDARDGRHIWGERYDRAASEISAIERDLSRQISERLQMRLSGEDQSRMNRRATVDPEAYRLYLKGRHEWNKRTPQGIEKGIELFRQSIDVDPAYAPAHAGIADSYLLLGGTYEILPPRESMPIARQSALRALEIDPELADAHASLGVIAHEFEWDWPRAEQSFRRAIELNPNYGVAHQWYGQALLYRSRPAEALVQLGRAVELDPLSLVTRSDLAQAYWITGQYDTAIAHAQKLTDMAPQFWLGYWFLGLAHAGKGDLARATATLERAVALGGSPATVGTLGYVHGRAGRRADAERLLKELRDLSRERYVSPAAFATIYIGLGDLDRAFQEVERAIEERAALVTVMHVVPVAEPLRRDARYVAYARRVGLPPVP